MRTTYSGRAAIYQYLARLRACSAERSRSIVLAPALHCPTVIDPILQAGYRVRYYGIDRGLNTMTDDFLSKLDRSVAAAIFIRYFGIVDTPHELFAACREVGAHAIEDCCHSFLTADPLRLAQSGADAMIYSFWKLVPSKVGGGILLRDPHRLGPWPAQEAPSRRDSLGRLDDLARQLCERPIAFAARLLKRRPAESPEEPAPAIRKPASEAYPYDPQASLWSMPATSRIILERADLESIVAARRRNYHALASALISSDELMPFRPALSAGACPWGFPVFLSRRAERDYLMRAAGVPLFTFGEVLHPTLREQSAKDDAMLETAELLSSSLLAFSIHQGLSVEQVRQFVAVINDFIRR